jgi:phage shock protein C
MNDYASQQQADQPPQDQPPPDQSRQDQPAGDQPAGDQSRRDQAGGWPPYSFSDRRPAGGEPLFRPVNGRIIAGVAQGIANYLGVDGTIVRIALVLLTVMGGAGIPVYVAGWLLIPDEEADQSIAAELISSLHSRTN